MKRGKDDEKAMGPMFPRLHVNDAAEKGGPRAPPRNKMALYEQLSIPSQRFGSGIVPLNPHSKPSFVSSASSSQGSGLDKNTGLQHHLSSSTSTHWPEKFPTSQPDGTNSPNVQFERRKKGGDEDDFAVPVFVQASVGKSPSKIQSGHDRGNASSISSTFSGQPEEQRSTSDKRLKHRSLMDADFGQARNQHTDSQQIGDQNGNPTFNFATNQPDRENDACVKDTKANSKQDHGGHGLPNFSRMCEDDANLHQESRVGTQVDVSRQSDDIILSARYNSRSVSYCGEDHVQSKDDNEPISKGNKTCTSLQFENVDKGDDVSETSMVDSASGLDITPDDVVGIIGQKHFWKARKAIVNQQRVFAVQVFELHRLIKVQRLIAGSPHILIGEGVFLGEKHLTEGSPVKELYSEFAPKPLPSASNCKEGSEKPSNKRECSTVNMVEKTALSSAKNGSQSVNHGPSYMSQQKPVIATDDGKMNPWYFHQPPGPQWLVPVMSPSEGLVYKPYTGPGAPGAVYGGYGPFGPIPTTGNFTNSAYGVPPPHPQGMGGFHGNSPAGNMFFPSYGMPVSNPAMSGSAVEQMSQFTGASAQSQTGPVAGSGVNLNAEQQSSCTAPPQKIGSVSQPKMFQVSKGSNLQQGSTASSCREMQKGVRTDHNAEGKDPLPLFPLAPQAPEGVSGSSVPTQPTRAIKVVPHNPRSATESAARIFRSIQKERQQADAL